MDENLTQIYHLEFLLLFIDVSVPGRGRQVILWVKWNRSDSKHHMEVMIGYHFDVVMTQGNIK